MKNKKISLILLLFLAGLLPAGFAFASNIDGTIDSTYKYVWCENAGWINFGTVEGNIHITDEGLTGYAWGENIGWLYLDDVINDGNGNLDGYAWCENAGWVDFNSSYGGVSINSSGEFSGHAWGENIGWIVFDCSTSACVKTDWRPQNIRPACNNTIDDDNDGRIDYPDDTGCDSLIDNDETNPSGGGLPMAAYNPPSPPSYSPQNPRGEFKVLINNDEKYTNNQKINLSFVAGKDTKRMSISNSPDFKNAGQISYSNTKEWVLTSGYGNKTIYVKFYTQYGQASQIVSDSIIYEKKKEPIIEISEIIKEIPEIIKQIPEIIKISEIVKEIPEKIIEIIPEFLKLKPDLSSEAPAGAKEELEEIPIEELVPEKAPLAMSHSKNLLSQKTIEKFVLAPLPQEIRELAKKFPELGETLKKVGITKITDIEKFKNVKLTLPGLTERMGLTTMEIQPGTFALPKGVPVAELSPKMKQQMPSEIVFAKTSNGLIDFNIALTVNKKGEPQQKIATIAGKPLQLVVKPDHPVKSIKGYIVFRTKKISQSSFEFLFSHLTASLIFTNPVFAQHQEQPVRVEEKLVLLEFEYTDPDGDGIYTAEIPAPLIEGEYEIITVMEFENPELGKKEIRLITVVDPEGYIYEKDGNKETRIPGAIVSIYWLNSGTKQYELWPAKEYQQENPQITNTTGKYSFLVPEGSYYLKVETPGYLTYDGKPFEVKEGRGVHINIELKTQYWWLKIVDWKTFLLIVVILFLMYNFYRDRIREKILKLKT